jgi:pimeloyl-ACP methyl ester carboxylesterase
VLDRGGIDLAYEVRGDGAAVLLIHGMADDRRGWAPEIDALAPDFRVIAYDRRGYGESGAPEVYERTSVAEQTEDAAALIEALDAAPAIVAGVDFGALVCLDLLLRHRALVNAAVLLAPTLYELLPGAADDLAAQRVALGEVLHAEGPEAAVVAYLAGAPPERIERARRTHRAFFADYGGLPTLPAGRRELTAIDADVVLLEGAPGTLEAAVAKRLAGMLPRARLEPGADVAAAVRSLTPRAGGSRSPEAPPG